MLSKALRLRLTCRAHAFSTRFCTTVSQEETGLYGFTVLRTAQRFKQFFDEATERANELVSRISELPPSNEIIKCMAEISDTVCSVIDSAELSRNTHPKSQKN